MKKNVLFLICMFLPFFIFSSDLTAPSDFFDLSDWILQIPGPINIKDLKKYASPYFFLTSDNSICFSLDAKEKGHTKNSQYVRSELRHKLNWKIGENHEISASIKVVCDLEKYQVTVVQIHGITDDNENAPPLLRIAVVNGGLYSFLKTDPEGKHTEKKIIKPKISNDYFLVDVKNDNSKLTVSIDGIKIFDKELKFWKYKNYYKLGCYPQEHSGHFQVYVKNFQVN